MEENIIVNKSFSFSLKIIDLYKKLNRSKAEAILADQLLRSGTSIGANVMEGVNGQTKADFKSKMSIALKEAKETEYWIKLFIAAGILKDSDSKDLLRDCNELCRILSSIINTCNRKAV